MAELRQMQTDVLSLENEEVIKLPYAKFVHGKAIDFNSFEGSKRKKDTFLSLDNFIIMEDVRATSGFKMTNRRNSLDIHHMRLVFSALDKVHALSWAYRHHDESNIRKKFPFLVTSMDESGQLMWVNMLCSNLDLAKIMYDEEFGPGNALSAAAESYKKHAYNAFDFFMGKETAGWGMEKHFRLPVDPKRFGKDAENPEPWKIICHGDCWSNNMLFRYDEETGKPVEIILVDLQIAQETCVVNDLQYVTYTCTDSELRKNHLDELLQLYHDTFNSVCSLMRTPTLPGFNIDSLKFRFHRAKFLGYLMAHVILSDFIKTENFLTFIGLPIMLKEAEKAIDMDNIGEEKNHIANMLSDPTASFGCNAVLKKRLTDVAKDLIADGVI